MDRALFDRNLAARLPYLSILKGERRSSARSETWLDFLVRRRSRRNSVASNLEVKLRSSGIQNNSRQRRCLRKGGLLICWEDDLTELQKRRLRLGGKVHALRSHVQSLHNRGSRETVYFPGITWAIWQNGLQCSKQRRLFAKVESALSSWGFQGYPKLGRDSASFQYFPGRYSVAQRILRKKDAPIEVHVRGRSYHRKEGGRKESLIIFADARFKRRLLRMRGVRVRVKYTYSAPRPGEGSHLNPLRRITLEVQ
jgi:hypothetical protein